MRIAALDELHGTLERDPGRGQNHMQVIRHQREFMEEKFLLPAIGIESFDEKICHWLRLEKKSLLVGAGGHEIGLFSTDRWQSSGLGQVHLSG